MKKSFLPVFFVLLLLSACGPEKAVFQLEGLWIFPGITQTGNVDPAPDCFLNLERNGKYTMFIPDYFDYGYWQRDASDTGRLIFKSSRAKQYYGSSFTMQINEATPGNMQVSYSLPDRIQQGAGNSDAPAAGQVRINVWNDIELVRSPVQYPDSLDPYSFALNRWRIRPAAPENCRQISYRTINYLKHMYALFYQQYRQKAEKYNYSFSPSPILFGQNGIATINFDEIPAYWKATFYDEGQAKQSCAILYSLFDEKMDIPKDYKRYDELWSKLLGQMLGNALTRDYCSGSIMLDTAAVK